LNLALTFKSVHAGETCSGTPCGYQASRHTHSVRSNLLLCIIAPTADYAD